MLFRLFKKEPTNKTKTAYQFKTAQNKILTTQRIEMCSWKLLLKYTYSKHVFSRITQQLIAFTNTESNVLENSKRIRTGSSVITLLLAISVFG